MTSGAVIHCTSADETRAVLLVRPEFSEPLPVGTTLTGVVRGPYSQQAHTLPAEFKLEPNSDDSLQATIIDPCYSTDELPMQYQFEIVMVRASHHEVVYRGSAELQRKT